MIKKTLLISILALFLLPTLTEGANWLYFIENERGDKFYIEMDSIRHTSHDTVRLLKKVEPGNSSKISSLVSDIELDCKGSRIKFLKETTYFKDGKTRTKRKNEKFQKVTAEDIEESLLELVCSLKKI
ncbi:hypothetical protein BMS3Abin06_00803 [bacterium BMS3Abin06]|nr:hypothetical protein BMS3Abin06_00803 [bacterium BMS3Abin06]HDZ01946.1 hypothetical protein [Nitrospirota bacterium]